jgi:outer membrane protein assembly factor BamB
VSGAEGQPLEAAAVDYVYDPFTSQEQADFGGDLSVHYQVPLVRGNDVWLEAKSGTYTPPAPDGSNFATRWNTQIWNERRLRFANGRLVQQWNFESDWKPVPPPASIWEPVFHAALVGDSVFVPGAGGTVFELDAESGRVRRRFQPFGDTIDPSIFVAGPIAAGADGNVYYDALKLTADFQTEASWLVRIDRRGQVSKVSFTDLVPDAPTSCLTTFDLGQLPWPPSPDAVPPSAPCGIQRAALNVAPAIAPDGTVYTVSYADHNTAYTYLVAVRPDLKAKWAATLRDRLNDGCGVLLPIAPDDTPQQNACRTGTHVGVDPRTNQRPAGEGSPQSSSSPVVMPDGDILFGANTGYNAGRGHLFKFDPRGSFLAAFDFGWDVTPSVFVGRDHREHVVVKDNYYTYAYCPLVPGLPVSEIVCKPLDPGPYYITQLDANLVPEWRFQNTNTQSCQHLADGSLQCVSDHPEGFEWCVNAPVVDRNDVVYANSEDGRLYAIGQGHHGVFTEPKQSLFLNLALGAAYTPLSMLPNGFLLSQNNGHLFVVGRRT